LTHKPLVLPPVSLTEILISPDVDFHLTGASLAPFDKLPAITAIREEFNQGTSMTSSNQNRRDVLRTLTTLAAASSIAGA
jgi:hypothetical protein